ncbi:MAG: ferrous iron transporter B, partial [Bdellovibrionota bacterium]
DEQVTHNVLFHTNKRIEKIDALIVVLDATQLSRHLLLAKQAIESSYPILFVVTMRDLIEKEGTVIDLKMLKTELGGFEVILFDGVLGRGLDEIVQNLTFKNFKVDSVENKKNKCPEWSLEKQTEVITWAKNLSKKVFTKKFNNKSARDLTNKLDLILLHPFFGFVLFFIFMSLLFSAVYWAATPVMDIIDGAFGSATTFVTENIPGLAGEFLGSGLITAIGGVVIFIPQIFILFFGIGLLESTGYLARVAALIDKPLSLVGLGGRSFVPLLSGFACAIPAIMATRNITSKKEKIIAQSIIPFMTCSARLPVYALLIGFMYGTEHPFLAGFLMAIMYFGGILIGALAARGISFFIKDKSKSRLLIELPIYRRPHLRLILWQSMTKAQSFVFKAGPIILCLAIVLWFATNFPRVETGAEISGNTALAATEIAQQSYAAQVGKMIEPIFKPMGIDWRVGFGLISAFAAREVFVSSLALMFNVQDTDEAQIQSLTTAMKTATFADGTLI